MNSIGENKLIYRWFQFYMENCGSKFCCCCCRCMLSLIEFSCDTNRRIALARRLQQLWHTKWYRVASTNSEHLHSLRNLSMMYTFFYCPSPSTWCEAARLGEIMQQASSIKCLHYACMWRHSYAVQMGIGEWWASFIFVSKFWKIEMRCNLKLGHQSFYMFRKKMILSICYLIHWCV